MEELSDNAQYLTRGMIRANILKFGEFTLKSGAKSVAYVNLREMISSPSLFQAAAEEYDHTLQRSEMLFPSDDRPRFLLGIAEAATYYAGAVGARMRVPLLYRRVKPKEHGQPRAIEGRFNPGDEVILLDDVITKADSKLEEAEAVEEAGLVVEGVVVLVDRQQGGRTQLESRGIQFASALTLNGLARYALEEGLGGVTQTMYDELLGELNPNELTA